MSESAGIVDRERSNSTLPAGINADSSAEQPLRSRFGGGRSFRTGRKASQTKASGPGLLNATLQRLNRARSTNDYGAARTATTAAKTGNSSGSLIADLLTSVFDIRELDPLPLLGGRNKPADGENTDRFAIERDRNSPAIGGRTVSADRRMLPRRESGCSVDVYPFSGDKRLAADRIARMNHAADLQGHLVDVSMSGVAVHLKDPLAPATGVVLRMTNRMLNRSVNASAKVLRCSPDSDGGWNVVCRFHKNLTFDQIHVIGRNLFAGTIV